MVMRPRSNPGPMLVQKNEPVVEPYTYTYNIENSILKGSFSGKDM